MDNRLFDFVDRVCLLGRTYEVMGEPMACITKILEKKGNKDYLVLDRCAIEDGGVYKDYEYLITFTSRGHRCGYVALKADHVLNKQDLVWLDDESLVVHGGITFHGVHEDILKEVLGESSCEDKWVGFDAMHGGDEIDLELVKKLWPTEKYSSLAQTYESDDYPFEIRTCEFMVNECKSLIDQIIEFHSHAA